MSAKVATAVDEAISWWTRCSARDSPRGPRARRPGHRAAEPVGRADRACRWSRSICPPGSNRTVRRPRSRRPRHAHRHLRRPEALARPPSGGGARGARRGRAHRRSGRRGRSRSEHLLDRRHLGQRVLPTATGGRSQRHVRSPARLAGSIGKTGAAALAGRAALRSGVGLCTVATAASQQPIVAGFGMEVMTEALPETAAHSTFGVKARLSSSSRPSVTRSRSGPASPSTRRARRSRARSSPRSTGPW